MTVYSPTHEGPPKNRDRIALSPWTRESTNPVALAILETRAASLGVWVSTAKLGRFEWSVRVFDGAGKRTSLRGDGSLLAMLAAALDDYEAAA